ncbi:AAA-12 domain-containing protein [Mycena chlorophos]|uniref:AAA-12 domain-containing protein n=1 Tax=Mycena chlorophos TaxID=658473 RepID=A0A8H6VQW8_MYCCL|nr:AAA-12 domain-containing protein [Mycena chlorophos]
MSLSATKLAAFHHYSCDLYLHNSYHLDRHKSSSAPSETAQANFQRGVSWERLLFAYLEKTELLLTVPPRPIDGATLSVNIELDDREHFFISGVEFWPPAELFERFARAGSMPVNFGLAKPDLLEITRTPSTILWRVIDAKASQAVKTSHHVQIYFYYLCLTYLLPPPLFQPADSAAIWLPPANGFDAETCPSLDDLRGINVNLLAPSLDDFLFRRLPKLIFRPRDEIRWHLNPLCNGCPFESDCTRRAVQEGQLGSMPNISLAQVEVLRTVLGMTRTGDGSTTDIEDLHQLFGHPQRLRKLETSYPSTLKKAKRILAMRRSSKTSPILDAARTKAVQVIPRRNFTLPGREDISVVISVVTNPSASKQRIASFCISVFSCIPILQLEPVSGPEATFVSSLTRILNKIQSLNDIVKPTPLTQIYVFSSSEEAAVKAHLLEAALTSASFSVDDLRLCIGSIVDGAALLQTNFQPLVLSGALLSFNKSQLKRQALHALLERMGMSTAGTVDELRARIEAKIAELQNPGGLDDKRIEIGQLPRVVVLKREIESLLALPVPGHWDLSGCALVLLHPGSCDRNCPSDEDILKTYRHDSGMEALEQKLEQRNASIYAVLQETRRRIAASASAKLVNVAKPLSTAFLDVCQDPHLRKLFFMQQFEVLAKLSELWKARIDGCPDAPILEYKENLGGSYSFYLVSGAIDVSGSTSPLYGYLLTEDDLDPTSIPPEALFDDLPLSGCLFPLLHRTTKSQRWDTQNPVVVDKLCIADVRDVALEGNRTKVELQIWGRINAVLRPGCHYRLSPRLVDFNTSKVLSTLLELDIRATSAREPDKVPFLQLVVDPRSFGDDLEFRESGKELARTEKGIQSLFRQLRDLEGLDSPAGALQLKPSQHKAVQRILSSRLSVLWGPPGTGKTYTIALALLRLVEAHHRLGRTRQMIVFICAQTHAAIDAVNKKLVHLLSCYESIDALPTEWLKKLRIERVLKGNEHAPPSKLDALTTVFYLGTVYQLYNFSKRHSFEVDVCVIDEAGQLALSSAALVLRSLGPQGRIVVAGDSEQLAPILTATYPNRFLFGSILDCLMHLSKLPAPNSHQVDEPPSSPTASEVSASQDTVVQLTENFRLNPDLGDFVSTIYARKFTPQKVQAKQLATQLQTIQVDANAPTPVREVREYLVSLSSVMLRKPQSILQPPAPSLLVSDDHVHGAPRAISLALLRLQTQSVRPEGVGYEAHVRGEAAVAAALVTTLQRCCPEEDIFIATPHRIQRQAVRDALRKSGGIDGLVDQLEGLSLGKAGTVTVDTVERLQGSEAGFVICLFSLPSSATPDLGFLLERRRLNVAISRAKTLCILVSSSVVLRPPVSILANEETAKGYAFLRAFEDRAWSSTILVNVDAF